MPNLEITLSAVSVPSGASATLTVLEDVGDDGGANTYTAQDGSTYDYDNSASTTLSTGETTYTLSGFDAAAGNRIWPVFEPDNSDVVSTSELSEPTSIKAVPPDAPSNLAASAASGDQNDLSWDDNANSEDGFYVYRAQSSGSTASDYTQIADLPADTTSYSDTGLEDGERYYYRVSAYNSVGESDLSNEADATTTLPSASDVTLDDSNEGEITVSWTRNDDSPDGEWEVYRSTDGSLGTVISDGLSPTTTSITDTGLNDGERYWYTVRRITDHASADSSQAAATTVLPAPTSLSSPAHTAGSIDLEWAATHNYGDTRVEYRPTDESAWTTDQTVSRTTESATVDGLRNGEAYDLRVVAQTEHVEEVDA